VLEKRGQTTLLAGDTWLFSRRAQCFADPEDRTIWQADFDDPAASFVESSSRRRPRFVTLEELTAAAN